MAAGLLLTSIQLPYDGRPPDWAAGHRAIEALTFADLNPQLLDALHAQLSDVPVDDQSYEAAVVDAARRRLHRHLNELGEVHGTGALGPEVLQCTLFGHRLLMAGGISLGGSPGELYDAINELTEFPQVTHAMGCDLDLRPKAAAPSAGGTSELLEGLERQLAARGIGSDDLDDLVHDTASHNASQINNGGLRDQLAFLVEQLGEQGLRAELGIDG
jgi:hypothetical protein